MKALTLLALFCLSFHLHNALDCTLPSQSVVNQALRDEVTSAGGEGGSVSIRGGPNYTCLVQGNTNVTYQELSVIMDYTSGGIDRVGQFEMTCANGNQWNRRQESLTILSTGSGVTYDGSFGLRTDCSSCINTAGNDNNCVGCDSACNIGLMRCTGSSSDDCCITFDSEGNCRGDFNFRCNGNPCGNGSTCTGLQDGYNCTCVEGFTGENCESDINECTPNNPCNNNGTCMNEHGGYSCMCVDEYTGENCETDLDECESNNPCMIGATCMNQTPGYLCLCPPGVTGNNCDMEINHCNETSCLNGGTCVSMVDGFECMCLDDYTGLNCETNIDECSSNPCKNGATCINEQPGYSCTCSLDFTGANCNDLIDPYAKCKPTCSDEKIEFEKNMCLFYCQLEEWRETVYQEGLELPQVNQYDSGYSPVQRWKKATDHHQLYYSEWLKFVQERRLEFNDVSPVDDDSLVDENAIDEVTEWRQTVELSIAGFTTWREYFKQLYPNAGFQDYSVPQTEGLTQEELYEVYNNISRVWSSDFTLITDQLG